MINRKKNKYTKIKRNNFKKRKYTKIKRNNRKKTYKRECNNKRKISKNIMNGGVNGITHIGLETPDEAKLSIKQDPFNVDKWFKLYIIMIKDESIRRKLQKKKNEVKKYIIIQSQKMEMSRLKEEEDGEWEEEGEEAEEDEDDEEEEEEEDA